MNFLTIGGKHWCYTKEQFIIKLGRAVSSSRFNFSRCESLLLRNQRKQTKQLYDAVQSIIWSSGQYLQEQCQIKISC